MNEKVSMKLHGCKDSFRIDTGVENLNKSTVDVRKMKSKNVRESNP